MPPARPTFSVDDRAAIAKLIEESLASGSLTLGPNTERLEEAFATRHGVGHAVAVSSGTAALEIALRALAGPAPRGSAGRTVIVPANTFFATAAAVVHAGGVPALRRHRPGHASPCRRPRSSPASTTPAPGS